jgi:HSP20 family molecular chaperone IbpA
MVLSRRPSQAQMARRMMDRWMGEGFLTPTFEAAIADSAPSLNVRETPDAYLVEVEMPVSNPTRSRSRSRAAR